MKQVDYSAGTFLVTFAGPDFRKLLPLVKALPDALWVPSDRQWEVRATDKTATKLKDLGFQFVPEAEKWNGAQDEIPEVVVPDAQVKESRLKGFFHYQVRGVRFLEAVGGRGVLGDQMGLGKTLEAIGYFLIHRSLRPVVVVCPATAKGVWRNHIRDWTGESVEVLSGRKSHKLSDANWWVINYDILGTPKPDWKETAKAENRKRIKPRDIEGWALMFEGVQAVVADECHFLSNPDTIRTNAFRTLLRSTGFNKSGPVIMLSGTPMRSRVRSFFTALNIVSPTTFPNRYRFYNRYCDPQIRYFGKRKIRTYDGAEHLEELHARVAPFMIRRLKDEVLADLPPKIRAVVPMELDPVEVRRYSRVSNEFLKWVATHEKSKEDQEIVQRLYQRAYLAKRNAAIEWVRDYLESGSKLVAFAWHRKALDDIAEVFKDVAVRIDGGTPMDARDGIVDRFQNDDQVRLFVGQTAAAGVALTLTAASATAFLEFAPTATDHLQAEDRVHRLTQTADSVMAYYLIAPGTVEEDAMAHMEEQFEITSKVLDGRYEESLFLSSAGLLSTIVDKVRGEKR